MDHIVGIICFTVCGKTMVFDTDHIEDHEIIEDEGYGVQVKNVVFPDKFFTGIQLVDQKSLEDFRSWQKEEGLLSIT
jgi:hypothetical protein